MFQTQDKKKKFGNSFVGRKYDSMHPAEEPESALAAPRTASTGEAIMSKANANAEPNDVKANPEGVDANAVVAQHGPAHTVHVAHDHKANKHHVVSSHKDGHVHMSDHGNAKDAHDAAATLGGAGGDQPMAEEPQAPESDGFSMPKLA